jgi:nucleoside phosphorylase
VIAVTFALPAESAAFLRLLRDRKSQDKRGLSIISGNIDNHAIQVLHTGVGETVSRERLTRFLQDRQFDLLISAGFAGSLTKELRPGDLLLAKNFSTVLLEKLRGVIAKWTIHVADLYTGSAMISSTEDRQEIAAKTGTVAVDMETKFIARACAERELLLLSLRVISDSPLHPFPAPPEVLFDVARQKTVFTRFAAFFTLHPKCVPKLISFAHTVHRARNTLARALADMIRNLPP